MVEIWPSLISADILDLKSVIQQLDPHCYGYHLDIMDNHFVPNLTWGAQFVNAIAAYTTKPLWIHLMIETPEHFLRKLKVPKDTLITFHIETASDINLLIEEITKHDWKASAAINPETCIETVFPFLERLAQVLIMTVNPGQSGQELITSALEKILPLTHIIQTKKLQVTVAIDGGVNRYNISQIHALGVEQFGIAAGIFAQPNAVDELMHLYNACTKD